MTSLFGGTATASIKNPTGVSSLYTARHHGLHAGFAAASANELATPSTKAFWLADTRSASTWARFVDVTFCSVTPVKVISKIVFWYGRKGTGALVPRFEVCEPLVKRDPTECECAVFHRCRASRRSRPRARRRLRQRRGEVDRVEAAALWPLVHIAGRDLGAAEPCQQVVEVLVSSELVVVVPRFGGDQWLSRCSGLLEFSVLVEDVWHHVEITHGFGSAV